MKEQKSSFIKLEQFKNKKNYKKIIAIIVVVLLIMGGIIIGSSFANFKVNKSFKVMEGNFIYETPGDVILNFYEENKLVTELSGNFDFEKANCNNNATIAWNGKTQEATITNLTQTGTICDIYYSKNQAKEFLENLQKERPTELAYDGKDALGEYGTDDNNLRFIGENPNNYISFNNETWRIIGVMNNVEDEFGNTGSHLKIIRNDIGNYYSWDSSPSNINNGYGVNEWSEADIQKVLNDNYYNKKAGGICYGGSNEQIKKCPDWESIGLNDEARAMVSKIKWNTATVDKDDYDLSTPVYMYKMERSENNGKICSNSRSSCNDDVKRIIHWTGYVGLMYPSDYGFSTSGGNDNWKIHCLTRASMQSWGEGEALSWCAEFSWLYNNNNNQWTITSRPNNTEGYWVYFVNSDGNLTSNMAVGMEGIRPVVYLNSNIKISGEGSSSSPFQISVEVS